MHVYFVTAGFYTQLAIFADFWVQRLVLNDWLFQTSTLVKGEITTFCLWMKNKKRMAEKQVIVHVLGIL